MAHITDNLPLVTFIIAGTIVVNIIGTIVAIAGTIVVNFSY